VGGHVIDARERTRAPREAVWEVLADAPAWSDWGPWSKSELEREGSPPPGGVGAIKHMTRAPMTIREEVTEFEPPTRLGYRMLSGLPVRDYRAMVTLSDAADGTEIHWHSEFDARIPGTGWFFERSLGRAVADVAQRLARESERRASA
jgi:hypothetical protein